MPTCAPKVEERLWIPPKTMTRMELVCVPAKTRMKNVEKLCVRVEPVTLAKDVPVYETVEVADRERALLPVTQGVPVTHVGYQRVCDTTPVVRPVYATRQLVSQQSVCCRKLDIGFRCGKFHVVADTHRCQTVMTPQRFQIGEEVVEIPAGCHLEEMAAGVEIREVAVGAREVECVTGTHYEQRQVCTQRVVDVIDERRTIEVASSRKVPVVVRPSYLEAVEREYTVPGRWVRICTDPSKSNGYDVMTRMEYYDLTGTGD